MKNAVKFFEVAGAFTFAFFSVLPAQAVEVDTDADGLTDEQEAIYYTDPKNADTDNDDFFDGVEVKAGYSPHERGKKLTETDYDGDGLNDFLELQFGTDIGREDTDQDGHSDWDEVTRAYDPLDQSPLARFSRRVEVDLTTQRLFYIVKDIAVKNFPVSTGLARLPTPTGQFKIFRMLPMARYVGQDYDFKNVKWNMQFRRGGYFLHGAYWHNDFGKRPRSHGCVNMRTEDAAWLYEHVETGVSVVIKGKTPRGWVAVGAISE